MKANFIQRGEAVDFVPSYDVGAGEIIRFGSMLGVVKVPVRTGELGALHLSGIYDVNKGNETVTAGSKVYWDEQNKVATCDENGNLFLGIAACHSSEKAGRTRVILNFGHLDMADGASADGIQWRTI